jgi:hypothetical protein
VSGGTGDPADAEPPADASAAGEEARRRADRARHRRQVFGDVLDGSTLDDRPDPVAAPDPDRWLRDNVPPHHG